MCVAEIENITPRRMLWRVSAGVSNPWPPATVAIFMCAIETQELRTT